jgi:hypothetical protein
MFDTPISAMVRVAKGVVKDDGDVRRRRIRLQLERTFSDDVAAGLGSSARVALDELEDRGIEKVVLPIGALRAVLVVKAADDDSSVRIMDVTGIKAVGVLHKAGGRDEDDDGDGHPIIRFEFEFPYADDAWVFLGHQLKNQVTCTFTRKQLDLPGTNGDKSAKPETAAKKSKGRKKNTAPADPQSAATPEEAEDLRAAEFEDDPDPEFEPAGLGAH